MKRNNKMRKRVLSIILAAALGMTTISGCASNNVPQQSSNTESESVAADDSSRIVVDSLGREVAIPNEITKVIPTGQLAQIMLLSLCPDMMVALASEWDEQAKQYIAADVEALPVVGQLYGGKSDFNLESILAVKPDLIIDVGTEKKGMSEDMDALCEQVGIPFVHIDGSLEKLPESYRLLGDILGKVDEAEERAVYAESMNTRFDEIASQITPINALLITGSEGLNVIPKGSYQGEAFDKFANNLAVVEEPSTKGTGNEVDMEQILTWNPDVIIYLPETTDASVFEDDTWQEINAVKNNAVYPVPYGPYDWLGFPASIQRYLGMMWMVDTFYPKEADSKLHDEVRKYYKMFYGYDLSMDQFDVIISGTSFTK